MSPYKMVSYHGTSQSQRIHTATQFINSFNTIRMTVYAIYSFQKCEDVRSENCVEYLSRTYSCEVRSILGFGVGAHHVYELAPRNLAPAPSLWPEHKLPHHSSMTLLPALPCSLRQPGTKHDNWARLLYASRPAAQISVHSVQVSHSPTQQSTDPYNSLNISALLQAILQTPIANHDLAAGSPRVAKLAHLLVLFVLQFVPDLKR
jgi:hypothetical protein